MDSNTVSSTGGQIPVAGFRRFSGEDDATPSNPGDTLTLSKKAMEEISASDGRKDTFPGDMAPSPKLLRKLIRACLTPDLLKGKYKKEWTPEKPGTWGHCYVASEAYYHLMGGKSSGLRPFWVKHEDSTHCFLRDGRTGKIVDLTADQFKTPPPYEKGKAFGWLTGETPSKRAQKLMARVKMK